MENSQITQNNGREKLQIWEANESLLVQNEDEIENLIENHLNPRKSTYKLKEINTNLKYVSQLENEEYKNMLKDIIIQMKAINLKFTNQQDKKLEEKSNEIRAEMKMKFNEEIENLQNNQGIFYLIILINR